MANIFTDEVLRNAYFNDVAKLFGLCLLIWIVLLIFRKQSKEVFKLGSIIDAAFFAIGSIIDLVWISI